MIDTHAHIFLEKFESDIEEVIIKSQKEGVEKILMPNINRSTHYSMLETERKFPEICRSMMGLHPCYVKEDYKEELKYVEEELEKGGYVAVGEIGTDLYWDKTYWEEQKEAFVFQMDLAKKHQLPVVIHCRESMEETIDLVESNYSEGLKGVFHCFNGTVEQAKKIINMGFYLGIGGVSTFKNGGMDPVLKEVPLQHMVLETDSPYLAPVPFRGKRNEPSYLVHISEKIGDMKGISTEEVNNVTTENARKLFQL